MVLFVITIGSDRTMKVFVSSTYEDLKAYRQKAIDVLNHYKCTILAMEFFGSLSQDAETVCEKEIRECDIFIGIYAHRYGYVPEGKEISITQMEYELARDLGKTCLCFTAKKGTSWDPDLIDMENYPARKTFWDKVQKDGVVDSFTTPEDFSGKLAISLANAVKEQKGEDVSKGKKPIPTAPIPYIAHPYALPRHFTGRQAEMAVLSNWFYNDPEPVFVMEAIGGMGKTAMSWVWMQNEILAPSVELDGVFWWSFYDEPFESFIPHLWCYVTGKEAGESIDLASLAAALHQRRFLLVLDGLERALRGYAGMEAMFIQEKRFEGDQEGSAHYGNNRNPGVVSLTLGHTSFLSCIGLEGCAVCCRPAISTA